MNIRVEDVHDRLLCSYVTLLSNLLQRSNQSKVETESIRYLSRSYIHIYTTFKAFKFQYSLEVAKVQVSLLSQTNRTVLHFGGVVGEHTGYLLIIY